MLSHTQATLLCGKNRLLYFYIIFCITCDLYIGVGLNDKMSANILLGHVTMIISSPAYASLVYCRLLCYGQTFISVAF